MVNIYVGNLSYSTSDAELQQLFGQHGEVRKAQVVMDRETGRSRGFGFVEMADDQQARNAINALNGQEIGGRKLVVNEAKPREARPAGGGGGGRGGWGGGGGGGGRGGYSGRAGGGSW